MTTEIEKFRLKIRNTERVKRDKLQYTLKDAKLLNEEIKALEERIDKLEVEALQQQALSVHIVGREF